MKPLMLRARVCALLICAATLQAFAATEQESAPKYEFKLAPSVELAYTIDARQRGFPIDGSAIVRWSVNGSSFSIDTETRAALFGKIMHARTVGAIDDFGLAPVRFDEKRFSKTPTATSFDRTARSIRFSASDATYPINGGEQDRNSIVWQLIAVARATPARFKPGSEWTFFVAGQRNADLWTFKVLKTERLQTALGPLDTLQIARMPADGKGQQLDLWLAPQREWYPVRLRFSDDNGDYVDQTLQRIVKKK